MAQTKKKRKGSIAMNIPHLNYNPGLAGQFRLRQNIAYSAAEGSGMMFVG